MCEYANVSVIYIYIYIYLYVWYRAHGQEQKECTHRFFEHLAVCHTVIPEKLDSGEIRLSASSPDEQALVAGAQYMGYAFTSRAVGKAMVDIDGRYLYISISIYIYINIYPCVGRQASYEILEVLEFNSTRKRMSVIVRLPTGQLYLYTKGADMMIYQRLKKKTPVDDHHRSTTRYTNIYIYHKLWGCRNSDSMLLLHHTISAVVRCIFVFFSFERCHVKSRVRFERFSLSRYIRILSVYP